MEPQLVPAGLSAMSLEQLRQLNQRVVQEIKWRQDNAARDAIRGLRVGQPVKYVSERASHGVQPGAIGTILKVKSTRVDVKWTVTDWRGEPRTQILNSPASFVEPA